MHVTETQSDLLSSEVPHSPKADEESPSPRPDATQVDPKPIIGRVTGSLPNALEVQKTEEQASQLHHSSSLPTSIPSGKRDNPILGIINDEGRAYGRNRARSGDGWNI